MTLRVLVTVQPAAGHLRSLVPVARALAAAGHVVSVAAPRSFHAEVASYGLDAVPAGPGWSTDEAVAWGRVLGQPDRDWRWQDLFWLRLEPALRTAEDLVALAPAWRPDLVVRDCTEFGGSWAAEILGVPHVPVSTSGGVATLFGLPDLAPRLDACRAALGLPPDPALAAPNRYLFVNSTPPAFDPAELTVPNVRSVRHELALRTGEALPASLWPAGGGRRVLASLGTAFHGVAGRLEAIVEGLARLGCPAIVAAGADPERLADLAPPSHVRVVESVAQPLALRSADLLVTHGGINSIREALLVGVPMVVAPVATDQPRNALRCEALGVARALPASGLTASAVVDACRDVLGDPGFRRRAHAVRRGVLALPSLASLVPELVALCA
ncbi:MAG TPA: glycosyltransferase [Candidatus Dormibacteraeota bacterium]|nr:glycosyltransferase [Candidatus Dormibacteraeota bacterium]